MSATDQPNITFRELTLTPEQQEQLAARIQRAVRRAVRKAWDASE